MRILFVAPYIPSPIRVRPYQWIRALARLGHQVRLVALRPPEDGWVRELPVADCVESAAILPLERARTLMNGLRALPSGLPLQAAYSLHPQAEALIATEAEQCDVVHVEHLRGALLARKVRGVPTVIDAVDSIAALFEQTTTHAPSWRHRAMARLDLDRTRRFEATLPHRFDRTIVTSVHDADAFRRLAHTAPQERIVTLPNGVDLEYFRPSVAPPERATILFTGKMSYHANEAAALRLVRSIMPRVWERQADARVVIAGKDPSAAVTALANDARVTVTGYVDDLRPLFWRATLVAAPLVYGTGIQNKVLEAMACGVAVVASPKACDGVKAVAGHHVSVGRNDDEMAARMCEILERPERRAHLGAGGRQYVTSNHDWREIGRRLVDVYEEARAVRRCA